MPQKKAFPEAESPPVVRMTHYRTRELTNRRTNAREALSPEANSAMLFKRMAEKPVWAGSVQKPGKVVR